MNTQQQRRVYREVLRWLSRDWLQMPAVVSFVNEAVGAPAPFDVATQEARDFVSVLIAEERVVVGSVDPSAGDSFRAWPGGKMDHIARVLELMPLGISLREEWRVWFDKPGRQKPNKALEPTPPSVTPRAYARVAPAGVVAHL